MKFFRLINNTNGVLAFRDSSSLAPYASRDVMTVTLEQRENEQRGYLTIEDVEQQIDIDQRVLLDRYPDSQPPNTGFSLDPLGVGTLTAADDGKVPVWDHVTGHWLVETITSSSEPSLIDGGNF